MKMCGRRQRRKSRAAAHRNWAGCHPPNSIFIYTWPGLPPMFWKGWPLIKDQEDGSYSGSYSDGSYSAQLAVAALYAEQYGTWNLATLHPPSPFPNTREIPNQSRVLHTNVFIPLLTKFLHLLFSPFRWSRTIIGLKSIFQTISRSASISVDLLRFY